MWLSAALLCFSPLLSLFLSCSIPLFELPKDGPPLVDRLTYYKSTKRLNHHLGDVLICFPFTTTKHWPLPLHLDSVPFKTLKGSLWGKKKKKRNTTTYSHLVASFLFVPHISSALWQCMTPGSRPYLSCTDRDEEICPWALMWNRCFPLSDVWEPRVFIMPDGNIFLKLYKTSCLTSVHTKRVQ